MTELRRDWICTGEGCGIRVYVPGKQTPPPRGWNTATELCLRCSRDAEPPADQARRMLLAGETVRSAAHACLGLNQKDTSAIRDELIASGELEPRTPAPDPPVKPKQKRVIRPRGDADLAEAEMRADPSKTTRAVAEVSGMSVQAVRKLRKKIGLSTAPRRDSNSPGAKAAALLKADPSRSNAEIAEEAGAPLATVKSRRRSLGLGVRQHQRDNG